ncbi:MAG TPA: zinc ribbon domain-containing protein [Gemmatimonadales bacterium]|nr:zinc ribbon domain-containing protein [Gemmatimonadales bacterium]
MNDLDHFFRQLVANLSATDPARLYQPISIADIQNFVIPYRANRRALGLTSAEDYEVLLLRLCAGERGLARTDPPEIQATFKSEAAGTNPDLRLLRTHGDALVSLSGHAVALALAVDPHAAYAPPAVPAVETFEPVLSHTRSPHEAPSEELLLDEVRTPEDGDPHPADAAGLMCLFCGGALPADRPVNFCPHCGQSQTTLRCPACQAEIELGWRHCAGCGAPVGDR